MPDPLRVDFLVVGSGIAGLWFALRVGKTASVLILTKKQDTEAATNYAQGGIAVAVADNDSAALHSRDTLAAGLGLAHPDVAEMVTSAGPRLVRELTEVGVRFSTYQDAAGRRHFDLGREGGHHRRRILHSEDFTGLEIERGLLAAVRAQTGVTISEHHFAQELVTDSLGRCRGAWVLDTVTKRTRAVLADGTLLAAGGVGQAYIHTTNPPIATGDGIAMGFRAGARVGNMEFVQFHPTSFYGQTLADRAFLISEALRGEGAVLTTRDGSSFMEKHHPDASLAPRDAVARAVDIELKSRGEDYVLLDATHLDPDRTRQRFPGIWRQCKEFGIDMTREPIPVVPAAHYVCGGLAVDSDANTSVPGLLAAGECAFTGLHGANRLASNSLLEALVFADRAAASVLGNRAASASDFVPGAATFEQASKADLEQAAATRETLRKLMWDFVGIVRSDVGLRRAWDRLSELEAESTKLSRVLSVACAETRNLVTAARLVVACALRRPESRGLHFNQDHPEAHAELEKDTIVTSEDIPQ
ncbi:MAG: L-aspartate oxidase [candidate division WOR-3 bacterium]|nr:MAG: L-aspartate oxidase [candidate division WOR-3 bacterium]